MERYSQRRPTRKLDGWGGRGQTWGQLLLDPVSEDRAFQFRGVLPLIVGLGPEHPVTSIQEAAFLAAAVKGGGALTSDCWQFASHLSLRRLPLLSWIGVSVYPDLV